jgi:hypothetical protein
MECAVQPRDTYERDGKRQLEGDSNEQKTIREE